MTAETVCSAFHVPAHMVGVGAAPTYNNIEALTSSTTRQCLQSHIENIELLLDEGLELPKPYGTEFDLDGLLRMDTATKVKAAADAVRHPAAWRRTRLAGDTSIWGPPKAARGRISKCRTTVSLLLRSVTKTALR